VRPYAVKTDLKALALVKAALARCTRRTAELERANAALRQALTEHEVVAAALGVSDERFRHALEYAPIGMSLIAPDGRFLQVNPALCGITGYSTEELLATTFPAITYPDDWEPDLAYARQLLAGEIQTYEMEKRYIHKQGHVVWVQVNGSLVRDATEQPLYFIAQIQDITERKQELNARLRQMERWRDSFVRLMGHELRTPLGHVLGFADLLSAERDRLSPARQRHLAHLQTGALRLQALIERMFEIMSLFTGEDVLARAPVNLTYLLATALSAQRGRADEAGITMTVGLPTTPLTVLGDEPRLSRLLTIVLDNALRYTPPGGSVAVTLAAVGAGVEARIADSGPGIAPELQEYVFSGAQAEDVLTREHGGLGLSLLLARRIAEAHGGALRLDQPVQGACVVLWLPTPRPLGSAAAAPEGDGTRGR